MNNATTGKNARFIRRCYWGDRFVTNATLVLCPAMLIKQWTKELEKNTRPHLNVVILNTLRAIKNCSYRDIMDADVVLFSHKMLLDPEYFHSSNNVTFKTAPFLSEIVDRREYVNVDFGNKRDGSLNIKGIVIDHFLWHRIVVDEAHEAISDELILELLNSFHSNYRWYVSGTPFPDKNTVSSICNFLRFPVPGDFAQESQFINICLNNLYWRNTKDSVANEYEIPPLVEDLVLLDFSPVETILYQDCKRDRDTEEVQKICNSPLISPHYTKIFANCSGLNTFQQRLISYIGIKLETVPKVIHKAQKHVEKLIEQLAAEKEMLEGVNANVMEIRRILEEHEDKKSQDYLELLTKAEDMERMVVQGRETIRRANAELNEHAEEMNSKNSKLAEDRKALKRLEEMDPLVYVGPDMSSAATIATQAHDIEAQKGDTKGDGEKEEEEKMQEESKGETEENKGGERGEKEVERKEEKEENTEGDKGERKLERTESDMHQEVLLPWSKILEFSVAMLRAELTKRGIQPTKKQSTKKALQKLLKDAVKNNIKPLPELEEQHSKLKRKNSSEDIKPAKRVKKNTKSDKSEDGTTTRTTQDKIDEQNLLLWWVEKLGTKLGNLMMYLKRLWEDQPNVKVIIFSQFTKFLQMISDQLEELQVEHALVDGNVTQKGKKFTEFTKEGSNARALLLNIAENASGLNIIEATHIILMEPIQGADAKSIEAQAIGRAHRQGQTAQVTVVRFVVRDTIEHTAYMRDYGMQRTASFLEEDDFITRKTS